MRSGGTEFFMRYCFAVIDLGSNSVRMTINGINENGEWCVIEKLRETVRLGEGMSRDNFLKEESMERVIKALKGFCEAARKYKCVSIAAVATAAVRRAANGKLFTDRIKKATGICFEVISGEEEAYYSYIAVKETVGITNGVIFDTGGGSTEISLVRGGELKKRISLPLGAVILTERMAHSRPMQMYRYAMSYIGAIEWLDECEGLPLYGIGGSARALAMLHKKERFSLNENDGIRVPCSSFARIYRKVFSTPPEKRREIKGMDTSRADIILAGLTPAKVLTDMICSGEIIVCAAGVKEGVFFRLKNEIEERHGDK